jgi:hypothetical protein
MDHDDLVKEAQELEKSLSGEEKLSWAFRYSYVANQEMRVLIERLGSLTKLVWGVLIAIMLMLGSAVVAVLSKFATG